MNWLAWAYAGGAVYVLGFVAVLWFNISIGPVTFGLSLLRALLWPLYVLTGIPAGSPLPMD